MFAHGILTTEQHAAAQRYRMLRAALYGCPLARNEGGGPAPDPDRLRRLQRDFDALVRRLTRQQKAALTDLALDLRPPWLRPQLLGLEVTEAMAHRRQELLEGLEALAA
jgi:hypothetical protein